MSGSYFIWKLRRTISRFFNKKVVVFLDIDGDTWRSSAFDPERVMIKYKDGVLSECYISEKEDE